MLRIAKYATRKARILMERMQGLDFKGSALACMSEFPFARVEGIEISNKLASICVRNFERLKRPKVKVHNIDATKFTRFGEYKYFYFYNPFPVHVSIKSWQASPSNPCP